MEATIMLCVFFILIAIKIPMAVAIGISCLVAIFGLDAAPLIMLGQQAFEGLWSFPIVAIPFYILAGNLMSRGGISQALFDFAYSFVGRITGGLAMVVVLASAFFAALSGSSTATTVAIGGMALPKMLEKGYGKDYALAIAAAGGVLGPIIPPSVGFVLYGVATETSVADLFLGGIVPGVVCAILLMIMVFFTAKKRGYKGTDERFSWKQVGKTFWVAKYAILVPVIILGGIYGGIFTPTEAGAVACVYSILVSMFVQRTVNFKELIETLAESCLTTAAVMFLVGTATTFGRILTMAQVPQQLAAFITEVAGSRFMALLMINIFLLIVGCIMDSACAILILSPMLLPVVKGFGVTGLHFGLIVCLNLTIGAITPPVGCCLFAASVMGQYPLEKIAKAALPFLFALIVGLMLVTYIPALTEFLPAVLDI